MLLADYHLQYKSKAYFKDFSYLALFSRAHTSSTFLLKKQKQNTGLFCDPNMDTNTDCS